MVGTVKAYVIMFAGLLGGIAAIGVINRLVNLEWLSGFVSTAVSVISTVTLPTFTAITLIGTFNTNNPEVAGYKYYHALPNSAGHFGSSILFSELLGGAMTAAFVAVTALFFRADLAMCTAAVSLFAMGMVNFMGYTNSLWAKMIPLCVAGGMGGAFFSDFVDGAELAESFTVFAVMTAVSAAVFTAGVVFAVVKARSAWESEGEKCAD